MEISLQTQKERGLGVIKLHLQNDALLMKNLDIFSSKADLPWVKLVWSQYYANGRLPGSTKKVSFWWISILKLRDTFKGIAGAEYGTGDTIIFWHDVWNQVLKVSYPQLHSFAKNDLISLNAVMQSDNFDNLFHLPLTEVAYDQYCELTMILQGLPLPEQSDKWSYIWGNGSYLVNKVYDHLMGHEYAHSSFKWIWRSKCKMKQKVFFWLLLQNRINTRGMLRRRNMTLDSYSCELCLLHREETLRHLFLSYPFAKNCWASINVLIPSWLRATRATTYMKRHIGLPFATEIIISMCWCIWKERNAWLFSDAIQVWSIVKMLSCLGLPCLCTKQRLFVSNRYHNG
jgi:hypothetical protein